MKKSLCAAEELHTVELRESTKVNGNKTPVMQRYNALKCQIFIGTANSGAAFYDFYISTTQQVEGYFPYYLCVMQVL